MAEVWLSRGMPGAGEGPEGRSQGGCRNPGIAGGGLGVTMRDQV